MFNDLIELGACEDVAEDVKLQKNYSKLLQSQEKMPTWQYSELNNIILRKLMCFLL